MRNEALKACVSTLLAEAGYAADEVIFGQSGGGGNNRIFFVVDTSTGRRFVAKCYFSHPSDKRDRLGAEFAFLSYATRIGLQCVPEPIAHDADNQVGLYEFIEGRKLEPTDVTEHRVDLAARFFSALNENGIVDSARSLPFASEACFSIADHGALVGRRIERLAAIDPGSDVDREALRFVDRMSKEWPGVSADVSKRADQQGIKTEAVLPQAKRCISPSDFGFHNALLESTEELYFIDFEYAGWDDPAKMAADFFCQPQVPVDRGFLERFLTIAMAFSKYSDELITRAKLLLPIYQMKWCCIVMNEFLTEAASRRRFANPDINELDRKHLQLDKAKRMFDSIQ